jgi:hypothetical protein
MNATAKKPIPVPDVFDGQTLYLSSVAEEVAVLAEYFGLLGAINKFVEVKAGNAIALLSTQDKHKQLLYVIPDNRMFITAALASHPRLRGKRASIVTMLLEEGRRTSEYQEMISARDQLNDQIRRVEESLKEMDETFVYPFTLSDMTQPNVTSGTGVPERTLPPRKSHQRERSPSRRAHKYSLPEYVFPRRINGRIFYLRRGYAEISSNNDKVSGEYHVADGNGKIYAVGDSFAEADRRWHESRGMSPNPMCDFL